MTKNALACLYIFRLRLVLHNTRGRISLTLSIGERSQEEPSPPTCGQIIPKSCQRIAWSPHQDQRSRSRACRQVVRRLSLYPRKLRRIEGSVGSLAEFAAVSSMLTRRWKRWCRRRGHGRRQWMDHRSAKLHVKNFYITI